MKLLDLVDRRAVRAELEGTDRNSVIRELVQTLADAGQIDPDAVDRIAKSIIARERSRGTTGFGKGVAVPHAKVEGQTRVVAAVGRSTQGVDFSSLDGKPVFGVVLLVSPASDVPSQQEEHLHAMDVVFRLLQ
ncbi:MAG: PTS sugar transporter subunit IIA, partial [Phycisphaerae bacterium]|nr:PTS sugar transporter subunit IIA [Phycisphaerae bacterium]